MKTILRFASASFLISIGIFHQQLGLTGAPTWSAWTVLLTAWLMTELLLLPGSVQHSWRQEARSARLAHRTNRPRIKSSLAA